MLKDALEAAIAATITEAVVIVQLEIETGTIMTVRRVPDRDVYVATIDTGTTVGAAHGLSVMDAMSRAVREFGVTRRGQRP